MFQAPYAGISLGVRPANARRRYNVTTHDTPKLIPASAYGPYMSRYRYQSF